MLAVVMHDAKVYNKFGQLLDQNVNAQSVAPPSDLS